MIGISSPCVMAQLADRKQRFLLRRDASSELKFKTFCMLKIGTQVEYKGKKFKIIKHRIKKGWIGEYYDIQALQPLLKNYFERIALVERSELEVLNARSGIEP